MSRRFRPFAAVLLAALAARPASALWVSGYYPGWRQSYQRPADVDWEAVTQVMHFGVVPRPDGTLDPKTNMLTPQNIAAAVQAAHDAGRRILFTVGGQNSRPAFAAAIGPRNRAAFVRNLGAFLEEHGYDGVDLDMEDVKDADARDYEFFVKELRARLDKVSPRPMLTAAVLWQPALFARVSPWLDQINLMTYDLSGPWPGWVTWHSGAVFDGGWRFPNGRAPLPSVAGLAEAFVAAGVPRAKLGVGMSFDGYVWSGGDVSRPRQAWSAAPTIKSLPYYELAAKYGIREYDASSPGYHWDADAQAPYLAVDGKDGPQFVSYQNEASAARLAAYARAKGLGGMIVWDLPAGWRADAPHGRKDLLLQAVKRARLATKDDRFTMRDMP